MTADAHYEWDRFWCPREGTLNLGDRGYLLDPGSPYGSVVNADLVRLRDISDVPVLALLGEPGIGKSTAIAEEEARLEAEQSEALGDVLFLDLRSFSSEDRLVARIVDSSAVRAVTTEGAHCTIILDSLDEALLRVRTVAQVLVECLGSLPSELLRVRIGCRTAEWPRFLEQELQSKWGREGFRALELVPLRRCDVKLAVETEGLQSSTFLDAVDAAGAVPLAIKPVTLRMLLRSFRTKGELSARRADLYLDGCRSLASELNESRRVSRDVPELDEGQLMVVHQRLAAFTALGNRAGIQTDVVAGEEDEDFLQISECLGGTERAGGKDFEVGPTAVLAAVRSGLFSARGAKAMGWAHRTYEEFLAARYLVERGFTTDQLKDVLLVPVADSLRAAPQLREIAAWVATLSPDFFSALIDLDPDTLLRSDVATAEAADRERLTRSFLRNLEAGKIAPPDILGRLDYSRLDHPGIDATLTLYIEDSSKDFVSRKEALEIAGECCVSSLAGSMVVLALDEQEVSDLRAYAVRALSNLADRGALEEISALLDSDLASDADDQLKGAVLSACWPTAISAERVFEALSEPKRESLFGAYWGFVSRELLGDEASDDTLLAGLRWAKERGSAKRRIDFFRQLEGTLIVEAWRRAENPDVRALLCEWLDAELSRHHHLEMDSDSAEELGELVQRGVERRRLVLADLLGRFSGRPSEATRIAFSGVGLVLTKDVPWLLDRLSRTVNVEEDEAVAELVSFVANPEGLLAYEGIIELREQNAALRKRTANWLDAVEIDSERANELRESVRRYQEPIPDRREPVPGFDLLEEMQDALARAESGDLQGWVRLYYVMEFDEFGHRALAGWATRIGETPAWEFAPESMRARVLAQARPYLLGAACEAAEWLGTDGLGYAALAGYRALAILQEFLPEQLDALRDETWAEWAPILVAHPGPDGDAARAIHRELVERCATRAPAQSESALDVLLRRDEDSRPTPTGFFVTRLPEPCAAPLYDAAIRWLEDSALSEACRRDIFRWLLDGAFDRAEQWGLQRLRAVASGDEGMGELVAGVFAELASRGSVEGFQLGWSLICANDEFAQLSLEMLADLVYSGSRELLERLPEQQLAELFIRLEDQFPHSTDERPDGEARPVTSDQQLRQLRDATLSTLRGRGSVAACLAIAGLMERFPSLDWLRRVLLDAHTALRTEKWVPASPSAILALGANSNRRVVDDEAALAAVVIDSLGRIQQRLRGEASEVQFLWNTAPGLRPKTENELSDFLKIELDKDLKSLGVVVNREVQIRPTRAEYKGERVDLRVDAVRELRGGLRDTVTVIVEVKCCWHDELKTAMRSQLVERYMRENSCAYGVYVVGWFASPSWDSEDSRRNKVPKWDLEYARGFFGQQAVEVSSPTACVRSLVLDASF